MKKIEVLAKNPGIVVTDATPSTPSTPMKEEVDEPPQEAKDDTGKPAKRDSQKLPEIQLEAEPKKEKEVKKETRKSKEVASVSASNLTQVEPPKPVETQEASSSQKKLETKTPVVGISLFFFSFSFLVVFLDHDLSFAISHPQRCQQTLSHESSHQRSPGRFLFVTWLGKDHHSAFGSFLLSK